MKFNEYVNMLCESIDEDVQSVLSKLGFVKVKDKELISYNIPGTGIYANFVNASDIDGGIQVYTDSSKKSKLLYAFDVYNFIKKQRIIKQLIDHVQKEKLTSNEEDFYAERLNK